MKSSGNSNQIKYHILLKDYSYQLHLLTITK